MLFKLTDDCQQAKVDPLTPGCHFDVASSVAARVGEFKAYI